MSRRVAGLYTGERSAERILTKDPESWIRIKKGYCAYAAEAWRTEMEKWERSQRVRSRSS